MADHHPERGPCRPWKVQKGKQTQRARAARKSRTPEEVYLRRRPTRPMPIPTSKRNRVQDPCLSPGSPARKPEVTSPAPPCTKAEGSACSASGLNPGQSVPVTDTPPPPCTRFVQDATHSVQQTHSKPQSGSSTHGLGHTLMSQEQARFPDGNSPSMPHPAAQSGCQDSNLSTKAPGKRAAQTSIQLCQKARKKRRIRPCLSPQKSTHTADLQPPHVGPLAKTLQPCQVPPSPRIPYQPIRMAFKRFHGGQWSCRLVTTPSMPPAEKPGSAVQSPPHLRQVRGTPSQGPWLSSKRTFSFPLPLKRATASETPLVSQDLFLGLQASRPPGLLAETMELGRGHHRVQLFLVDQSPPAAVCSDGGKSNKAC